MRQLYEKYIKRLLDIFFSFILLIILSPLLLLTSIFITVNLGTPIFFKQQRPGKNEKLFTIYKFRTMNDKRDEKGELLPDVDRLTIFGKTLRKTSIDELPELLNILKGNMSFVGPRPLAAIYLSFYTEEEKLRHSIRPGLTGLAQINGRNELTWQEKFEYDIKYVNTISFRLDVEIVISTVKKVLYRDGIGQGEDAPVSLHIERQFNEED
jgi:lipopolysaccharide/colanic/teichoic acid biosynthesis glycosyltransferase